MYEDVQEYYQQNIISYFSLSEQNHKSIEHNHIFSFEIDEDIQKVAEDFKNQHETMYIQIDWATTSLFSKNFAEEEILQNSWNIYISDLEDLSLHSFPLYDDKETYERSEESNAYKRDFDEKTT